MKKASSVDVARLAGVSQSTVSRIFNNSRGTSVSEETRAKVLAAAKQLGYRPNVIARSMMTDRTNIVGIVMPRVTSPFYAETLIQFSRALAIHDIQVMFFHIAAEAQLDQTLPLALQYQVDAVIITSARLSSELVEECLVAGTPVLLFNRYTYDEDISAVCCDNYLGGVMAADALYQSEHQRFAFVAGDENASTSIDRERGFTEQLGRYGIRDVQRIQGEFTHEAGYEAGLTLLGSDTRPDAIFCGNDMIAVGVMDAARHALGLSVPEDVSIIGFDNIDATQWPAYRLSTFEQPLAAMVDATIALLLEQIANPDATPVRQFLPARLIDRDSIRKP